MADRIADAERVHAAYLPSRDGLVVMGAALTEMGLIPLSENRLEIEASRDMQVVQSIHNNLFWGSSIGQGVAVMHHSGLLGPEQIHVHCNTSSMDALAWGTINGAKALGLESRISGLEPGKQADILIISGDEPVANASRARYRHLSFTPARYRHRLHRRQDGQT